MCNNRHAHMQSLVPDEFGTGLKFVRFGQMSVKCLFETPYNRTNSHVN